MAESTITIKNTNTNPVTVNADFDIHTISPTGITTPQTPYELYSSDMAYKTDGHITVPTWDKFQNIVVPAGKTLTLTTDDARAIAYYQGLVIDGAEITVDPEVIEDND